eukprot:scaffold693_cov399-Prasinococcus_capsulatus_cf.AAC.16
MPPERSEWPAARFFAATCRAACALCLHARRDEPVRAGLVGPPRAAPLQAHRGLTTVSRGHVYIP